MTETFTVPVPGASLAVEARGSGRTVVFLHAGVADLRMWQAEMDLLAATHRVVAYDRRGFGKTSASTQTYSHVDDLKAVLDRLGKEPVVLVGCSQGGRISIDFALTYPERVAGLVLVAPAVSGAPSPASYPPSIAARIEEIEQAEEEEDIDRINALEAWFWLDGPSSREGRVNGPARELFLDMNGIALAQDDVGEERKSPPAMPRIGQLTMPTLVIWGDLDFEHIQRRSAEIAATAPKGQAFLMPDTAHLPNLEQPKMFGDRLRQFLDRL